VLRRDTSVREPPMGCEVLGIIALRPQMPWLEVSAENPRPAHGSDAQL
jgi:hypothetical protein